MERREKSAETFSPAICLALGALALGSLAAPRSAAAQADMIVRTDILEHQWVVRDEKLAADACSVIEGGVTPGMHRLVRFTVMTANVGDADINIGDPSGALRRQRRPLRARHLPPALPLPQLRPLPAHRSADRQGLEGGQGRILHARHRSQPGLTWAAIRRAIPSTASCGNLTHAGNQGISHGWTDTYRFFLGGQYFVLDGGDGQPPVPPGDYIIRDHGQPALQGEPQQPVPGPRSGHRPLPRTSGVGLRQQHRRGPDHHPGPPRQDGVGPLAGTNHGQRRAGDTRAALPPRDSHPGRLRPPSPSGIRIAQSPPGKAGPDGGVHQEGMTTLLVRILGQEAQPLLGDEAHA